MSTASIPNIEQELEELVVVIGQNLTNTYITMSAIAFLLYDVLINMDREVEYIWKARWSVSKVLFIIGRYYGLGYLFANLAVTTTVGLSLEFTAVRLPLCRGWLWFLIVGGNIFYISLVDVILIMRLYAMYRNRKVLAFFVALFACGFAFELYSTLEAGVESYRTAFTIPAGIPLPGCFANTDMKVILYAWVPCMVIATAFFVMTVAKVAPDGNSAPRRLMDFKYIPPLLVSMVRDGALYYSLMFAILLITVLFIEKGQGIIVGAPLPYLIAVYSLTASRLVLNLREDGSRTCYGVSAFEGTITAPVFAMGPVRLAGQDTEVSYDTFE